MHLARRAVEAGAKVLTVTTRADSSLSAIADQVVVVPAGESKQFGGSLFEQSSLLLLDAVIIHLTRDEPGAHDVMRHNHTNLE